MAAKNRCFSGTLRSAKAICRIVLVAGSLLASSPHFALGVDELKLSVMPVHAPTGVLSGVAGEYLLQVDFPERTTIIGWSLSIAQRTLSRGEVTTAPARGDAAGRIRLPLQFPATKAGVSVTVHLQLQAIDETGSALGVWRMPVVIFPEDPFWERSTWLKDLHITLFDPEGTTIELFETVDIPFELARSEAAFAEAGHGLMIVGEGISWDAHRSLPATLLTAAAAGRRVVCLAPSEGDFPLPPSDDGEGVLLPSEFHLRNAEILPELEKRFSANWLAGQPRAITHCTLAAGLADGAALHFGMEGVRGWSWADFHYHSGKSEGRLILCGFHIVRIWNDGPEPRYLLGRMLEMLAESEMNQNPSP